MLRRSPLKRTPFRARSPGVMLAAPADRVRAPLTPIRAPEPSAPVFHQAPKLEYVRSEALMRAYRALPCQHCGAEGEAAGVYGAHSNWGMGKGMGIKASDDRAASLCWECHRLLDQGNSWTDAEKRRIWATSHAKTVAKLVALNLWPPGVMIPDTNFAEEWAADVSRESNV